jgi:hypothetical protein
MRLPLAALLSLLALIAACAGPAASPTPFAQTPTGSPTSRPAESTVRSPSAVPSAATSVPPGPRFQVVGAAPVIPRTIVPETTSVLAAAILHEGAYHAFVVGFSSDPTDHRLYHLTSPDAVSWTPDPAEPLELAGVALSHPGPIASTVLVEGETWVMYFSAIAAPARLGFDLWRATAPDPSGPWTAAPEPILSRGPAGAWDSMAADFPAVIRTAAGYVMLYQGGSSSRPGAGWIGRATSADGLTWIKHDDPSTTDPEHAQSDPVVDPGLCGGLDARAVQQPRLIVDGERLVLAYAGYAGSLNARPSILLAESSDQGATWRCLSPASALDAAGLPSGPGIHAVATFDRDGTPGLLVEWLASNGSDIWLAEMDGGLPR